MPDIVERMVIDVRVVEHGFEGNTPPPMVTRFSHAVWVPVRTSRWKHTGRERPKNEKSNAP